MPWPPNVENIGLRGEGNVSPVYRCMVIQTRSDATCIYFHDDNKGHDMTITVYNFTVTVYNFIHRNWPFQCTKRNILIVLCIKYTQPHLTLWPSEVSAEKQHGEVWSNIYPQPRSQTHDMERRPSFSSGLVKGLYMYMIKKYN